MKKLSFYACKPLRKRVYLRRTPLTTTACKNGSVAQLVEQRIENPRVAGSIPALGTIFASVAHLVERHLAKVEVASSSLVTRSKTDKERSAFLISYGTVAKW